MQRDLELEASQLQWVVTGYALTFGSLLLAGGRAADLLGRRRLLMFGLVLFAFASLAAGLAQSSISLIVAQQTGAAIGLAVLATTAATRTAHAQGSLAAGYSLSFLVAAGIALACAGARGGAAQRSRLSSGTRTPAPRVRRDRSEHHGRGCATQMLSYADAESDSSGVSRREQVQHEGGLWCLRCKSWRFWERVRSVRLWRRGWAKRAMRSGCGTARRSGLKRLRRRLAASPRSSTTTEALERRVRCDHGASRRQRRRRGHDRCDRRAG